MGILNSNLKIFQHLEKIRTLAPGSMALPPLHVRLKPTNRCNHRCWFCAYHQEDFQLGQTMSERDEIPRDKMMEILDDLEDMKVGAITFSGGGEPFVYPHLLPSVERLAKVGIPFASLTNGSRLSGELARVFSEKGTWIRISIDGWDGPSYGRIRSVQEGEFSRVLNNMEAFKKLSGPCLLSLVIVVTQENGPHLYEMIQTFSALGVDSIKISPVVVSNDVRKNDIYHRDHLENIQEHVARAKSDFGHLTEISDAFGHQLASFEKPYNWCPFLQIRPVIGADLNVYSCQDKAYNPDGLLFNIRHRRFKEAWFHDPTQFHRIDPSLHCNHHCVAHQGNLLVHEFLGLDPHHRSFV